MKSREGYVNVDARRLLQLSRSSCRRRQVILRSGIDPSVVARSVYRVEPADEQSPTALALGVQFEHRLYQDSASLLRTELVRSASLTASDTSVVDLQKLRAEDAQRETRRHVEDRLAGRPSPNLILQGVLPTDTFGFGSWVKPDLLIASGDARCYRPGEVKSFEDRAGYTDASDIDSAAAQAAVALVILQRLYPEYLQVEVVDIVLRAPSSLYPRISHVAAMRDIELITRAAQRWAEDPVKERIDVNSVTRAAIEALDNDYRPQCLQQCGLSLVCRAKARAERVPSVLGDDCARAFAHIPEGLAVLDARDVVASDWDRERVRAANALVDSVRADGDAA